MDDARPRAHALYLFGLLLAAYIISYVDRQVVALVVEPLKQALDLNDTDIGLIQGFAFSIFYAITGIPVATAIDRGKRVTIAAWCVAIWSSATIACGLVGSYAGFLLARSATAVSEAGLPPAAISMLADLFKRQHLARASTTFMAGSYLGGGIALLGGGMLLDLLTRSGGLTLPVIGHVVPWRALFLCVGAPGLIFALLIGITTREPPRCEIALSGAGTTEASLSAYLRGTASLLLPYAAASTCIVAALFAAMAWVPTQFIRSFGITAQEAGKMVGPVYLLTGVGGSLVAATFARGPTEGHLLRRIFCLFLASGGGLLLAGLALLMARTIPIALAAFALASFSCSIVVALTPLPIQLTAPNVLRGRGIAICGLLITILAGIGPFLVGFMTDHLWKDASKLGDSLSVTLLALGCGVVLFSKLALNAARHRREAGQS